MENLQVLFDKFVGNASSNLPTFNGFNQQTALAWAVLAVAVALRGLWSKEEGRKK